MIRGVDQDIRISHRCVSTPRLTFSFKREYAPEPVDNIEDYANREIFDETIILKCLLYVFQEEDDYEFIEESWDPLDSDYPIALFSICEQPEIVTCNISLKLKNL